MLKIIQSGQIIPPDVKKAIIQVNGYFDRNKAEYGIKEPSSQLTSDIFKISIKAVRKVISEYKKDPKSIEKNQIYKGRPSYAVDISHQEAVRTYIRNANSEGKIITLELIQTHLKERDPNQYAHITTIARTLDRWGFSFGKGVRTQNLKEKDHIVASRRRYLRKMRENRVSKNDVIIGMKRPEVYLDESYINKNHSNDFTWYTEEDGPWIQKPTGKGERLIILNAITKEGWVKGAKVVFKSTRKTGDYHGQMNADLFQRWFKEKLIPNIPENALIIMDNAPYHNVLTESSPPISRSSKQRIYSWLAQNKIPCNEDCLKAELIEILIKLAPEPDYIVDEIARKYGHEVIRTPPYHPELQPIEICWAVLKNHVARNCEFSLSGLKRELETGFSKVTSQTCSKIISKIRDIENIFWAEDTNQEEI